MFDKFSSVAIALSSAAISTQTPKAQAATNPTTGIFTLAGAL
jgi:hypothetical protein